jgi:hypothetical protein
MRSRAITDSEFRKRISRSQISNTRSPTQRSSVLAFSKQVPHTHKHTHTSNLSIIMSKASAPPSHTSDQEFETADITLDNSVKFTTGRPKGSSAAQQQAEASKKENPNVDDSHGPSFELEVDWRAGNSGDTDPGFRSRTGISHWNISTSGLLFTYRLEFKTDQTYYYEFQDGDNQSYSANVWLNGLHYIDYNSNNPNIVKVRGS